MNYIKITFHSMSSHLGKCITSTILFTVCLTLFGFSVFFYQCSQNNRYSSGKLYAEGLDRTGILRVEEDASMEKVCGLCEKIRGLSAVNATGDYVNLGVGLSGDLAKIQGTHQEEQMYSVSGMLELTFADAEMFQICDVPLQKNAILPAQYQEKDDEVGIYLGSAYQDSVKQDACFEGRDVTYRVLGFLEEGKCWPSQRLQGFQVSEISNVVDADYKVVALKAERDRMSILGSILLFTVSGDADFTQVSEEIYDLAEGEKLVVSIASIEEMIHAKELENQAAMDAIYHLFVLLLVVTVLTILCQQVVLFIKNAKEYEIMYAVGMSDDGITVTMGIENLIKLVVALSVSTAVICSYVLVMIDNGANPDWIKEILRRILFERTVPFMAVLVFLLFFIVTFVPMRIFRYLSPVELVKGKSRRRLFDKNASKTKEKKVFFRDRPTDLLLMGGFVIVFITLVNCSAMLQHLRDSGSSVAFFEDYPYTADYYVQNRETDEEEVMEAGEENVAELFSALSGLEDQRVILRLQMNVGKSLESYPVQIILSDPEKKKYGKKMLLAGKNIAKDSEIVKGERVLNLWGVPVPIGGELTADGSSEHSWMSILLWDNLPQEKRDKIIDILSQRVYASFHQIELQSKQELFGNRERFIQEMNQKTGFSLARMDEDESEEPSVFEFLYENYNVIFSLFGALFAVCSCGTVFSLWLACRKEEWAIRRVFGCSIFRILFSMFSELIKIVAVAAVVTIGVQFMYQIYNRVSGVWNVYAADSKDIVIACIAVILVQMIYCLWGLWRLNPVSHFNRGE